MIVKIVAIPWYIFCILRVSTLVVRVPPKDKNCVRFTDPLPEIYIMRFTIDLTKNSDLTEFNRLILANEGSQESTYELFLEDIILRVEQSGLISTKPGAALPYSF